MINTFNIHRDPIETALDQPGCPFSTSSFIPHPSTFQTCLGFVAKNKNAGAKRGFRDRRQPTSAGLAVRPTTMENKA